VKTRTTSKAIFRIPFDILKKSRKAYSQNNFTEFLFEKQRSRFKSYEFISYWNFKTLARCNCILEIDILGKVRAGKIML
jgi:hypothetical protein